MMNRISKMSNVTQRWVRGLVPFPEGYNAKKLRVVPEELHASFFIQKNMRVTQGCFNQNLLTQSKKLRVPSEMVHTNFVILRNLKGGLK